MANKDTSKLWFETGDFPTQEQFAQVFDWLRWKDEAIAINEITGLTSILNSLAAPVNEFTSNGPHIYTIPAGHVLEYVVVIPPSNCTVRLENEGTSEPGDIVPDHSVLASEGDIMVVHKLAITSRQVRLAGMPDNSKLVYVKRKIIA